MTREAAGASTMRICQGSSSSFSSRRHHADGLSVYSALRAISRAASLAIDDRLQPRQRVGSHVRVAEMNGKLGRDRCVGRGPKGGDDLLHRGAKVDVDLGVDLDLAPPEPTWPASCACAVTVRRNSLKPISATASEPSCSAFAAMRVDALADGG